MMLHVLGLSPFTLVIAVVALVVSYIALRASLEFANRALYATTRWESLAYATTALMGVYGGLAAPLLPWAQGGLHVAIQQGAVAVFALGMIAQVANQLDVHSDLFGG